MATSDSQSEPITTSSGVVQTRPGQTAELPVRPPDEPEPDARNDIVIGLIGAVGTHLDSVEKAIENQLQTYAYKYELVKLSTLIKQFPGYTHLNKDAMHRRDYYHEAIDGGNAIRNAAADASALVRWAVTEVHRSRTGALEKPFRGRCFVIDQIKTPQEVRFLRELYGELFYCIAVYADEKLRWDRLTREFAHDRHKPKPRARDLGPAAMARTVIDRDSKEKSDWGQNVRGAFVEADYFIRSDDSLDVDKAVERLLQLIFDVPYVSPTKSEIAMMHAKIAALRSADLSRQIGATVVARDGRILTTGCNEVPKAGGGQYWEDDIDDNRDFVRGSDANDKKKRQAILELLDTLNDKIRDEFMDNFPMSLYESLEESNVFADTIVDSLIEFGRIVHAEQAALNASCIGGINIKDADLYCTTYPCHMCARQIVNCGIRNVFYIEPYPKSQVTELYEDSIEPNPRLTRREYNARLNDPSLIIDKVYFIPFEGVAPRRYGPLFSNQRRKTLEGDKINFNPLSARPRLAPKYADPWAAEALVEKQMRSTIDDWVARGVQEIRERSAGKAGD